MVTELHWPAIAVRLLLTIAAGEVLGVERSKRGAVTVVSDGNNVSMQALSRLLRSEQIHIKSAAARYEATEHRNRFQFEIRWHRTGPSGMPDVIERLRQLPGVVSCEWSGTGKPMKD